MIWVIGRSQDPAGPPVDFLYYQTLQIYENKGISTLVIVTSKGSNVDEVKQSRRIATIREMSGHRGFRLDDEVAGLNCVCAASLTASRILIGEHSSEPMRAAAAPAMCITPVTAPPRGVLSVSILTATVFRSRRRLQCWRHPGGRSLQNGPAYSEHRQGRLSPFWVW